MPRKATGRRQIRQDDDARRRDGHGLRFVKVYDASVLVVLLLLCRRRKGGDRRRRKEGAFAGPGPPPRRQQGVVVGARRHLGRGRHAHVDPALAAPRAARRVAEARHEALVALLEVVGRDRPAGPRDVDDREARALDRGPPQGDDARRGVVFSVVGRRVADPDVARLVGVPVQRRPLLPEARAIALRGASEVFHGPRRHDVHRHRHLGEPRALEALAGEKDLRRGACE
mmetsp:Transcript_12422/g.40611  ORF Transcript_12422/g.40611 Transcript_12422/m.40611 type:complete len:228 (+) Transcript_12422:2749-3432(+)